MSKKSDLLVILKEKWLSLPQLLRFLFIGGFNTGFSYMVFCLILYMAGGKNHQLCLALQWILTSIVSFMTQKYLVFRSKGNVVGEYLKCCGTWGIGYLINAFLLELFVNIIGNAYIAQIFALGITAVSNFVLLKYWALTKKKELEQ